MAIPPAQVGMATNIAAATMKTARLTSVKWLGVTGEPARAATTTAAMGRMMNRLNSWSCLFCVSR